MTKTINPDLDGVNHIWLSPRGKTELGRQLYIGAHRPFVDSVHGTFSSIIAFWLWYDGGQADILRTVHHDNMIRSSLTGLRDIPGNRHAVCQVLRNSILQDAALTAKLRDSTLPFATYEVYKMPRTPGKSSVYPIQDREWYIHTLESLRRELR
jgi:hypothetical protein